MAHIDVDRIEAAVTELISAIGENPHRAGLADTPRRVAEAWQEYFAGLGTDPLSHLADPVELDGDVSPSGPVIMRGIHFRSMCEHHLVPVLGTAHLAYVPRDRVVGLGALPRVVETLATRPQLQERLTEQIADTLHEGLDAHGVLVIIEAAHGCVTARGVRQTDSTIVTLATRGTLDDPTARAEIMALISPGEGGDG
ncbi:MAG TPA: GTP cyclohydrolase I FolE [Terrimesophilobacter sp.]|nr:GTP cyclohydrolase I FolE [Terrimesophilobacter sp.]